MILLTRLGEVQEHPEGRESVVGWGQGSCILSQLCATLLLPGLTLVFSSTDDFVEEEEVQSFGYKRFGES